MDINTACKQRMQRRGQWGVLGGFAQETAKRNVKRYLFAAAVANVASLSQLLSLPPGLNYVNCKASRSGIVHHSMQKVPGRGRGSNSRHGRSSSSLPFFSIHVGSLCVFDRAGVCVVVGQRAGGCAYTDIHIYKYTYRHIYVNTLEADTLTFHDAISVFIVALHGYAAAAVGDHRADLFHRHNIL